MYSWNGVRSSGLYTSMINNGEHGGDNETDPFLKSMLWYKKSIRDKNAAINENNDIKVLAIIKNQQNKKFSFDHMSHK